MATHVNGERAVPKTPDYKSPESEESKDLENVADDDPDLRAERYSDPLPPDPLAKRTPNDDDDDADFQAD